MSAENEVAAKKLPLPAPTGAAVLLTPWVAFPAAAFCFIAGGFRLTADEAYVYEAINIELPPILEWQIEWGAWLGLAFFAAGLAILLSTRLQWQLPASRVRAAGHGAVLGCAGVGAVLAALVAIGVLWSGELIFTRFQLSLQQ